jgi:hypothetical protein
MAALPMVAYASNHITEREGGREGGREVGTREGGDGGEKGRKGNRKGEPEIEKERALAVYPGHAAAAGLVTQEGFQGQGSRRATGQGRSR